MDKLLLRPSEAAEALGIGRSKIYELLASGELPAVRVGGCVRVPVDALRSWIESRAAHVATPADAPLNWVTDHVASRK